MAGVDGHCDRIRTEAVGKADPVVRILVLDVLDHQFAADLPGAGNRVLHGQVAELDHPLAAVRVIV